MEPKAIVRDLEVAETRAGALRKRRDREILRLVRSGMAAAAVGREYGLTGERVRQIMERITSGGVNRGTRAGRRGAAK